jgi:hypothetical protein
MDCKIVKGAFFVSILLIAQSVFSHPGGLDAPGSHTNRSTQECHCHKAPSVEAHTQSKAALRDARKEACKNRI